MGRDNFSEECLSLSCSLVFLAKVLTCTSLRPLALLGYTTPTQPNNTTIGHLLSPKMTAPDYLRTRQNEKLENDTLKANTPVGVTNGTD